jgi:hypothetical protein
MLDEVVKAAPSIPGTDGTQAPYVRFAIGERGFSYTLYVTVTRAADGSLVQQELRKRALQRLRQGGVRLAEPNPFVKHP